MRKLLSICLAAIMLASCAPLALAREITPASVIDRIEIVGADLKPTTDKLPKDMEMGTMRAGGVSSSVEVSETSYWFDETDQYEADESMPFEARHYYSYCWVFTVKEGYELADSVTVTINGSADNYDVSTSDPRSGFIWCKPILCEADDGIITRVEIKNADITPFAGLTPADMGYGNMYADGSSSIISNTDGWWYCDSTMSNLEEEDTFEVGKRYSYCWLFELNSGYTVSSSTYVTINGSRSNVDEQSSDLEHGIIWCKSVICTEQDIEITVVDITNVTLNPPAGGRAGDYLDFETPFDLPLLTDDVYWFCDNYQTRLESDDMFEEGLFYSMCMIFEPMSGYTFADNLKVRINGSENNVGPEWTTITSEGYLIVWTTSHECVASGAVMGVTLDKTEATMKVFETLTLNATVLPEDATDKSVIWTSTNPAVATVENGVVTALKEGETTISVVTLDGYFTAECIITVTKGDAVLGDLNGDGKVNTADAVIVLKISAGMVALDEKYQAAGDCNRDGKVNTADAVLILKYSAGMIEEF